MADGGLITMFRLRMYVECTNFPSFEFVNISSVKFVNHMLTVLYAMTCYVQTILLPSMFANIICNLRHFIIAKRVLIHLSCAFCNR